MTALEAWLRVRLARGLHVLDLMTKLDPSPAEIAELEEIRRRMAESDRRISP